MCFARAVLSALYPSKQHAKRVSKYRSHLNSIDLTGLKFPVPVNQVSRFERNNSTISVNVYALGKDGRELIPRYVTKFGKREKHVDLLLLSSKTSDNFHYVWIKNLSALVSLRSKHEHKIYVCPHCAHPFSSNRSFENHFSDCSKHRYQVTEYPDPKSEKSVLRWQSRKKNRESTIRDLCRFRVVPGARRR